MPPSGSREKPISHPDLILAWLLYTGALVLAVFAAAIYIYSANALLPSKYVPASLDIPCMSVFLLLAVILVALGRSIELARDEDHRGSWGTGGVTDKIERLKRSKIYDRKRLNRLSEVDYDRRPRRRSAAGSDPVDGWKKVELEDVNGAGATRTMEDKDKLDGRGDMDGSQ